MPTRKYTEEQEAFLKRFKEEEHAKRAEELNAMIATTDNPAIKRELRQLIDLDWYQRFDR